MKILFIGLGTMGKPMARNLGTKTRHDLVLFDTRTDVAQALADELGCAAIASLENVPTDVDATVLMLPNSDIVESVLIGESPLMEQLAPGSLIIDMSSSVPTSAQKLGQLAEQRSLEFVDAPVSGGERKAISAELSIMAGGTEAAFRRSLPILEGMGTKVIHVGPVGSGDAAKALNNLLSATNLLAAAEIITAANSFGIQPDTMVEVINASTGRSQATEVKYPNSILTGRFDAGFAFDLMLKDLGIAAQLTDEVPTPITDLARSISSDARQLLGENPDHTELVKYYEDQTQLLIRTADEAKKGTNHD
ncbi:MAG: NAD(P)-dependent oxidoreductase [Gulosibacter sp.]|uniref:NAD(P)-dependent oxidoreductase n=1 Tax=Gulosibacter sp. TaxID=2817531 RepID=UPI003F929FF1